MARTLTIAVVFSAYIAGDRHRLPLFRSTSTLPEHATGLAIPRLLATHSSTTMLMTPLSCQSNQEPYDTTDDYCYPEGAYYYVKTADD
uniref:Uncharacterized protein n=1 Tax=Triticum urartu TaxID=4572 RepID=A0A8R7NZU5_TRIUA